MALNRFVDVFYMPNDDPRMPYHGYIWQAGRIINERRHRTVARLAEWCLQLGLPVRAQEADLRLELRKHGVDAQVVVTGIREHS